MKLQFNQTVQDKNTGEYYKPNTSYEFDDARAKEILSTGYAVVIEELKGTKPIEPFVDDTKEEIPKTEEKISKTIDERLNDGEMIDLYSLTRDELQHLAKEKGVAIRGSKEDIIKRLLGEFAMGVKSYPLQTEA